MKKHCEICGDLKSDCYYMFVARLNYSVFLNSPMVAGYNDRSGLVSFRDGRVYQIDTLMSENVGIRFSDVYPHIFCCDECENFLIQMYSSYHTKEAERKYGIMFHIDDFSPLLMKTEGLNHEKSRCANCNARFPNIDKTYKVIPVDESRVVSGDPNSPPPQLGGQALMWAAGGKFFQFRLKLDVANEINHFCSNECCYEFAAKSNTMIFFNNNVFGGKMVAVSKYTPEINKLNNKEYLFRPQKLL